MIHSFMLVLALGAAPQETGVKPPATPPTTSPPAQTKPAAPVAETMGAGAHRYQWQSGWGKLADGADLGNTHGCIAVDDQGLIYVNTDTEQAVMVFDAKGDLQQAWGKEFQGGLHGMTHVREGEHEFLYLAHIGRHQIAKATLSGKILWTMGAPKEAGVYTKDDEYRPTSVAVARDGAIYAADGYGKSWIHQDNAELEYVRSFGGPGTEPGKLRTPHGIWIDTRVDPNVLVVCDRENNRLQMFDLDGKHLRVLHGDVRRPCNVYIRGDSAVVADLAGRVTIFDKDWKVVAHVGDNPDNKKWALNGVPKEQWEDGLFISPHSAAWDQNGDLYVMDWLRFGRISKLRRIR